VRKQELLRERRRLVELVAERFCTDYHISMIRASS
jgi:hypothetical protein